MAANRRGCSPEETINYICLEGEGCANSVLFTQGEFLNVSYFPHQASAFKGLLLKLYCVLMSLFLQLGWKRCITLLRQEVTSGLKLPSTSPIARLSGMFYLV